VGTKNTALFDIVNRDDGQRFALARRRCLGPGVSFRSQRSLHSSGTRD
jgi:hypothetical protein